MNDMGLVYHDLGDWKKASELYEQALLLEQRVGSLSGEARGLSNLGALHDDLGQAREAIKYFEQALALTRRIGDVSAQARVLGNLGQAFGHLGVQKKALEYYEQSLSLSRRAKDLQNEARTLNNMGGVYLALGAKEKALGCCEQALSLGRKIGDLLGEALALNGLGNVYSTASNGVKALEYNAQALSLQRRMGDVPGEARTLNNMGVVSDDLGERKMAVGFYERSLMLSRQLGDMRGEVATLSNMRRAYLMLGEKDRALECYEQLRARIGEPDGPWTRAVMLDGLADSMVLLDRPEEAVRWFREATSLYLECCGQAEAVNRLSFALAVACKHRLLVAGREVIEEMREAGVSESDLMVAEAKLAGHTIADRKTVEPAWRRVLDTVKVLRAEVRVIRQLQARAAVERMVRGTEWKGCRGVLVSRVAAAPSPDGSRLRAGDILLRYGQHCLDVSHDVHERTASEASPQTDE